MRRALMVALTAFCALGVASPSFADPHGHGHGYDKKEWRGGPPDHAPAYGHRDKWREYHAYDWDRPPAHERYYADRYYRQGSFYAPFVVTRSTRIYRGNDGRYYCRRSDGTTGLIVGAAVGGLIGNQLGRGDSNTIATLIGAGAGALLGREIDRGALSCR